MSKIACIYFEGNETKVTLLEKEGQSIRLLKAMSLDTSLAYTEKEQATVRANENKYDFSTVSTSAVNRTYLNKLNDFFRLEDIKKIPIIPILSEPAVYFQKVSNEQELANLNINKKGKIETTIGFVQMYDGSKLAIYPSGQSNYLQTLHSLAKMNNKRILRIPTSKSAEISLANYFAKKNQYSAEENTLILYVGKDYAKTIFLKGSKLFHIGTTLSVGKNSFNAHNVLGSKILLELENTNIENLNNVCVCGEEDSQDLITSLQKSFPDAYINYYNVELLDASYNDENTTSGGYIIPLAVAEEYYSDEDKNNPGLNLLPKYIKDEQKVLRLKLQDYAAIALILIVGYFLAIKILEYRSNIAYTNNEIKRYEAFEAQNRADVAKLKSLENKIANVDQTKIIMSQLTEGTGALSKQLKKLSTFTDARRNHWISELSMDTRRDFTIGGYTFSRETIKALADSYETASLQNIIYDPLRDMRAFKFKIDTGLKAQGVQNVKK